MPDLFISHATKDDTHADEVAALLAEAENVQDLEKQGLNREKSQAMSCCL